MDDLNLNFDLDVSQLSAPDLQRLGITVAQVRAVYAEPVETIVPERTSRFPNTWFVFGFTGNGRFIFVALEYVAVTNRITALGIRVAASVAEIRQQLCGPGR